MKKHITKLDIKVLIIIVLCLVIGLSLDWSKWWYMQIPSIAVLCGLLGGLLADWFFIED